MPNDNSMAMPVVNRSTDSRTTAAQLESSSVGSPLAKLFEPNPLGAPTIRYPSDLGAGIHKHQMRIWIFQQKTSNFDDDNIINNEGAYDFTKKAGASKSTKVDGLDDGLVMMGGAGIVNFLPKLAAGAAGVATARSGAGSAIASSAADVTKGAIQVASTLAATALVSTLSFERKTNRIAKAYINLYMPETMTFNDRHDFDAVSVTDALGSVGAFAGAAAGGAGEFTGLLAEKSGGFGPGIKDLSVFSSGYAMNPQLEILYKGSKNREFVYSFKFIPRNAPEAEAVKNIIRTLRFHASPEYMNRGAGSNNGTASRYFVPPSEFEIEYLIGSNRNKNIPRIGQCVLSNIDVNYAAAGQYATFVDGMPVEISMQLTFTETIILTKEDIKIGY